MDINYAVTMFPRLPAVGDPSPEALYREQYAKLRSASRRKPAKTIKRQPDLSLIDAERDLSTLKGLIHS